MDRFVQNGKLVFPESIATDIQTMGISVYHVIIHTLDEPDDMVCTRTKNRDVTAKEAYEAYRETANVRTWRKKLNLESLQSLVSRCPYSLVECD